MANSRSSSGRNNSGRSGSSGTRNTTGTRKSSSAGNSRKRPSRKKSIRDQAATEVLIYCLFAVSLILFISNFGIAGKVGKFLSALEFGTFGVMAYIFPMVFFVGILLFMSSKRNGAVRVKFLAGMVGCLFVCGLIEMIGGRYASIDKLSAYYNFENIEKSGGGIVGGAICKLLTPALGKVGAYIIILLLIIVALVIITERSLISLIGNGGRHIIDSTRNDLSEYRENADRNRALREEKEAERQKRAEEERERRKKKYDKHVSGVDFSIEIPKDKSDNLDSSAGLMGKKIADNEVKEVFQSSRFSDNIIDISPDMAYVPEGNDYGSLIDTELIKNEYERDITDNNSYDNSYISDAKSDFPKPEKKQTAAGKPAEKSSSAHASHGDVAEDNRTPEMVDAEINAEVMQSDELMVEVEEKYEFPPESLLNRGKKGNGTSEKELNETKMKLQQTLSSFGVKVTVTDVSCGPAVTRYELQPEQGVKVSKIVSLADDIKLNLAAADIRIEAPIPGKAAVGIEVPNRENSGVSFGDIVASREFKEAKSPIAFGAGKDIGGQIVIADIAKMPHVLIAGATGSGKSVCINTIIMSILYKAKPSEVKLIMIDPKVVELSVYNGIPHLLIPVVTDPKKAAGALNWAVAEMDDRYKKFARYGVRDLNGYNQKVDTIKDIEDENKPVKLPKIVIIIDELADLMMVAKNEVEDAIVRLAQLARACGIHLVIATQRPSVDVITGLIKANVPSRIAFAVSSGVDSRTIIDMVGAEKLLGKGDMLFAPAGYPKPARVQGAFVSDNEVAAVVDFLRENCESSSTASYSKEISDKINNSPVMQESQAFGGDRDEYFAQAGRYIIEKEKGSIGMLQRVYKIGFNRAARIMDQLEDAGVVGPEEGTKPRKILMTIEEFENMLNG